MKVGITKPSGFEEGMLRLNIGGAQVHVPETRRSRNRLQPSTFWSPSMGATEQGGLDSKLFVSATAASAKLSGVGGGPRQET